MKKLLFVIVTLLMAGIDSAMAQSINGTWKANQEFKETYKLTTSEMELDVLLVFKASNIMDIKLLLHGKDAENTITMSYIIPGSYKKNGNSYVPSFNKEKAEFKIIDFTTTDPEMKEMIDNPETKKMIFSTFNSQMVDEHGDDLKELQAITDVFTEFEVVSLTAKNLKLNIQDEMVIGFDRQ